MSATVASRLDWLRERGFVHLTTLRADPIETFAFDHIAGADGIDVVYVAVRREEILYVGKSVDFFRRRYNKGHVRWLRGEKTNSESQRRRWVAEIAAGAIEFHGRACARERLEDEECALIAELAPKLNRSRARVRR